MDMTERNLNLTLTLDGNAAAGLLERCFGSDVTGCLAECDTCGRESLLGAVQAFTQTPGLVLRCTHCSAVLMRVVETPDALYLDARGLAYLCLSLQESM